MFGLSGEHLIIFVGILFVFGPKSLPQMGRVLGKTLRNFREYRDGLIEPSYRRLGETDDEPAPTKATPLKS